MSLDADQIVDRRRMRRKLTFWRVATVVVALLAIGALGAGLARRTGMAGGAPGSSIARISINGAISTNQERVEALDRLGKSSYKAVIVHINSPGGTVAGSEQLYDALVKLKAKKPMVVVVDGLAASGGYMAAIASDYIIAQQSSIVGSIGVLFQYPNVSDLLKTIGVKVETVRSTPLKAMPSGLEPTSPEALAAIDSLVKDSYAWFRGMVAERRKLADNTLAQATDGRVFTGRQGLDLKLIDALGNEDTAREWLAREYKDKGITTDTPVQTYSLTRYPRLTELPFIHMAVIGVLNGLGLTSLAGRLDEWGTVQAIERLNLDGLLALWHPPGTN
jgi:protease-4